MQTSEPAAPRRGRRKIPDDVKRRRLVEAAQRLIEQRVFDELRVTDIVAEAGMSSRTFYEFFASKDELLAEIVADFGRTLMARIESIFEETPDPVERIDRAVGHYLEMFARAPIDLEALGGLAGQRVRDTRIRYVRAITELVSRELTQAHTDGRVSRVADPLEVELAITGIEGLSFRFFAEGRSGELIAHKPMLVASILRAVS